MEIAVVDVYSSQWIYQLSIALGSSIYDICCYEKTNSYLNAIYIVRQFSVNVFVDIVVTVIFVSLETFKSKTMYY